MAKPKSDRTKLERLERQWVSYANNPKIQAKIEQKIKSLNEGALTVETKKYSPIKIRK